ncbi:hypothetical protein [Flavobacterium macacae]|uniref:Uncharacterized protein n=1 Tax=Flavobacterium macacae TaxID=2488993 RepID=A0A3P3WEQ8_9FLAO|nr:hypothetical protein [Flavobacterium macacae]RRJ92888.1 hypothetical protein EG849_04680 [Flavobacterium macacae]
MKQKLFTFFILLFISHFAFGQNDSISFEDKFRLSSRDCAHSHICCQTDCPCCPNYGKTILNLKASSDSLSNFAFGQDSLVVAKDSFINIISTLNGKYPEPKSSIPPIYKNTYVLSKEEKDSIWNAIFSEDKTQDLFQHFQVSKNERIYLIENQINLFAVLNSNSVNSKTKTELLLGKFEYDQKHPTENKYIQTFGTCGLGRPEIIEISSKEKAVTDYLNNYNNGIDYDSKVNLLALEGIMLLGVDYKKEKYVQAVDIIKKEKFRFKKLRNKNIVGAEVNTYQPITEKDLIIIYYEK